MLKKIVSLIGATGASGALTLLASVAPSWFMSAENYGYFSQFYVAISISSLLLGLGLTVSFTYYIGQGRIGNQQISSILKWLDGLCFVAALIGLLGIAAYSDNKAVEAIWYGVAVSAFFVRGVNLPSIYLGKQKIFSYNLALLLRPTCIVLAVATWVMFFHGLESLFINILIYSILSYLISFALSHYELRASLTSTKPKVSGFDFFGYGVIALLSNLSYVLGQRGFVYLLAASISTKEAGIFFMFLALLEVLLLVPSAIGLYFFPKASAGTLARKDVVLSIGLALGVFVMANFAFYTTLLVGQRYSILPENYIDLLRLMIFSIPLQVCMFFLKIFSQIACGYGLVRLTMYGSIIGGLISIGVGYFLVDFYQINGAVMALFFGNLLNIILVGGGLYIALARKKTLNKV